MKKVFTAARRHICRLLAFTIFCSMIITPATKIYADESLAYNETETRPPAADVTPYLRQYHKEPAAVSSGVDGAAAPLGNGHMGAMVYGGIFDDTIVINEKTLWSGGPGSNVNYNGGHNSYNTIPFGSTANPRTHTTLQQAREALDTAWKNYTSSPTGTAPASNVPNANGVGTRTAAAAIEADLFGAPKNTGFGSYQELGKILLDDPDDEPFYAISKVPNTNRPGNASEGINNLFNASPSGTTYSGKWYVQVGAPSVADPTWLTWGYDNPVTVTGYTIRTGNDTQGRDPRTWTLFASNDGVNFTPIDIKSGITLGATRNTNVEFTMSVPGPHTYKFFRLEVYATYSGNNVQMCRFLLKNTAGAHILGWGTGPDDHIPNDTIFDNEYSRYLNLETGICTVNYVKETGGSYKKEYFMNYPDNVFAMKMSSDIEFSQTFSLSNPRTSGVTITVEDGNILQMVGQPSGQSATGLRFFQQVKIVPIGPNAIATVSGRAITVTGAKEIVLLMTAGTNYKQCMDDSFDYFIDRDEAFQKVKDRLEYAASKGYNFLLRRHLEDYQNLFGRVDFRLKDAAGNDIPIPGKTTDQMVGTVPAGEKSTTHGYPNNTENEKRYIELLYYQFCRYLLIGCSREGSLPANLQGVWAVGTSPPWNADYHTNINVQMNYWPTQMVNLAETHIPMVEYVKAQVPRGQITANFYHYAMDNTDPNNRNVKLNRPIRGWICYHENNIWGNTAPGNSSASYTPSGGTWMSQDVWEYYQFTRDLEYLKEYYETIHGAAIFWVDNLWRDSETGKLMTNPSYSPEHGPYAPGATFEQGVIWESFEMAQRANAVLLASGDSEAVALANKYASEIAEIENAQSQLAGPKIGSQGQFMEWEKELLIDSTGDGRHRHTNHLFYLHPGTMIVPGRSAQEDLFAEAMKVTLNTRTDASTGWSMGWKINFWSRLRDGNRSYKVSQDLLTSGTLPNLFDTHSPFQIDGNFGGLSGMTEMLLQSQGGYIELLPALPDAWAVNGYIHGLKARGNVKVDQNWINGELTTAVLTSEIKTAQTVTVKYPAITTAAVMNGSAPVAFDKVGLDMISFTAEPNVAYTVVAAGVDYAARDAFVKQDAGGADRIIGTATALAGDLLNVSRGAQALYKMDFGQNTNAKYVELALAMGADGTPGTIEIWNGIPYSKYGVKLAEVNEIITGNWAAFKKVKVELLEDITGVKEIYVVFTGTGRAANLQSIRFFMKEHPVVTLKGLGDATSGSIAAAEYGSDKVASNGNSTRILFKDVDLLNGIESMQLRYATTSSTGNVTIYAMEPGSTFNTATATLLGASGNLTSTTNVNVFRYINVPRNAAAAGVNGVKDIYFVFNNNTVRYWGISFTLDNSAEKPDPDDFITFYREPGKVVAKINNNTGKKVTGSVLLAVYKEDGALVKILSGILDVDKDLTGYITFDFNPADYTGRTIKAFVWDDGFIPITKAKILE